MDRKEENEKAVIVQRLNSLRPKLLDLSRRNPLLSTRLTPRSNSVIRVIDTQPDVVGAQLNEQAMLLLSPLPSLEEDPRDEDTQAFQDALSEECRIDETYLREMSELDNDSSNAFEESRKIKRELKDRVRTKLGMAPRETGERMTLSQHAMNNGIGPSYDLIAEPGTSAEEDPVENVLQTLWLPPDLERKLNGLNTKYRTWIQETGINVLHVAVGFLEWGEPERKGSCMAPLILWQVELEKKKSREGAKYWVKSVGDGPETNLVLAEMLQSQFNITLPPFEEGSIEDYFLKLEEQPPETVKWRIRRQVVVGVFPSARMAMYRDLDPTNRSFVDSPIIDSLLAGGEVGAAGPYADDYDVDDEKIESKVPCLVLDADSSQFSAMVDVANGRNLALEGPPGTGKSQTIVNVIAAAIAEGKKVLFVAEKLAALEVVKSRLEAVGLGEFVLPLLARHSSREQVIKSLRERVQMKSTPAPRDYERKREKFAEIRSELKYYIELLASQFSQTDLTVHEVLGRCIGASELLDAIPESLRDIELRDIDSLGRGRREDIRDAAATFQKAWSAKQCAQPYWEGLKQLNVSKFDTENLCAVAHAASAAAENAQSRRGYLPKVGIESSVSPNTLIEIYKLLNYLQDNLADVDISLVVRVASRGYSTEFSNFLDAGREAGRLYQVLAKFLKDPGEAGLANTLRDIQRYCRKEDLDTLDPTRLNAISEEFEKRLAARRAALRPFEAVVKTYKAAADIDLGALVQAGSIARETQESVIQLRELVGRDLVKVGAIEQLLKKGRELRDQRVLLEESVTTRVCVDEVDFKKLIATFRNTRFYSRFLPSFRGARKEYMAISKRSVFNPLVAVQDLRKLWDWIRSKDEFLMDRQNQVLLGIHFHGLETNFDQLEKLCSYYRRLEGELNGPDKSAVRELLISAPSEVIDALRELPDGTFTGSFTECMKEISSHQAWAEHRRSVNGAIKAKASVLNDTTSLKVSDLAVLASRVDGYQECKERLASKPELTRLVNADLQDPGFNFERFDKERAALGIIGAMSNGVRDATLRALSDSEFKEVCAIMNSVIRADEVFADQIRKLSCSGIDFQQRLSKLPLSEQSLYLAKCAKDASGVYVHSALATAAADLSDVGFQSVVSCISEGSMKVDYLPDQLMAIVYRNLAKMLYSRYGKNLTKYSGEKLDDLRVRLAQLDREIIELSRRAVRATAISSASPPSGNGYGRKSTWTELALVRNEIAKKQRFVPVRDLTNRAGRAVQELKPCWMMSPLAVAQYLPQGSIKFDLCIIDEASQMPPEDAIGALARCAQVMVVGDTNQLPPTNFFRKMIDDSEDDEDESVIEQSILELANMSFQPPRRLRWHYRSRHSGLINFSNHFIYENDLVVFPSANENRRDYGISFFPVKGQYRSGINSQEASIMVEEALKYMRECPHRSLGLVTLNQKQRDLILEELDYAVTNDQRASEYIEQWNIKNDGLESFFVKNLENVQGDERDTIFIGTVYGPERPGGPVMQRFGPINGVSGRRRLNVLFSRAKKQIVTFSSMTSSDIRADEHGNPGAHLLKCWLEYVATGRLAQGRLYQREPDSAFEEFVIKQIKAMGYQAVPQVGVSGYFVDVGVMHVDWPHGFILGVECDGASYHSSRSARDRDRLREEVLADRGWKLHRIWSTDWFNDTHAEVERLHDALSSRLDDLKQEGGGKWRGVGFLDQFGEEGQLELVGELARDSRTLSVGIDDPNSESPSQLAEEEVGIQVGDKVKVRILSGSREVYELTLTDRITDVASGTISINAPLGKALIGAEEGDKVEYLVDKRINSALVERVIPAKYRSP